MPIPIPATSSCFGGRLGRSGLAPASGFRSRRHTSTAPSSRRTRRRAHPDVGPMLKKAGFRFLGDDEEMPSSSARSGGHRAAADPGRELRLGSRRCSGSEARVPQRSELARPSSRLRSAALLPFRRGTCPGSPPAQAKVPVRSVLKEIQDVEARDKRQLPMTRTQLFVEYPRAVRCLRGGRRAKARGSGSTRRATVPRLLGRSACSRSRPPRRATGGWTRRARLSPLIPLLRIRPASASCMRPNTTCCA